MLKILDEHYFVDLDEIEKYLDITMEPPKPPTEIMSGDTQNNGGEMKVNLIKFELVKMFLETVLSEPQLIDEQLSLSKTSKELSIPFKLSFNSLLNKKLIKYY